MCNQCPDRKESQHFELEGKNFDFLTQQLIVPPPIRTIVCDYNNSFYLQMKYSINCDCRGSYIKKDFFEFIISLNWISNSNLFVCSMPITNWFRFIIPFWVVHLYCTVDLWLFFLYTGNSTWFTTHWLLNKFYKYMVLLSLTIQDPPDHMYFAFHKNGLAH